MQHINVENRDLSIPDCIPEEMPLDKVILSTMGNSMLIHSQQVSSIVVLEDPCMNSGKKCCLQKSMTIAGASHFHQQ
jgi:hypothetical protein